MKHAADDNSDRDKALTPGEPDPARIIEIIDDDLDQESDRDPESTRLLAQWVKSSPQNADEVFKRFLLHALLRDHYQQQSYSQLLNSRGITAPPVRPLPRRLPRLLRYSLMTLLAAILVGTGIWLNENFSGHTANFAATAPYAVDLPHCRVLSGSQWGGEFQAPADPAALIGQRYNLFGGYAWFRLNPDCSFFMMGHTCLRPQRSDYIYMEHGRLLIDTTMPNDILSIELPNVIVNPGRSLFCVGYNKEYDCCDILVLSGTVELAAKADFFDYFELSAEGQSSATISASGFSAGNAADIRSYFGPLLNLPTLATGPTPNLDLQFIYEGFEYQHTRRRNNDTIPLNKLNGGWGWSGPWRELGGLDSQVVFAKNDNDYSDKQTQLSYIDPAGTKLASGPGSLQSPAGSHTHSSRKLGANIVPPALLTADGQIGQDNSQLWLSFLACTAEADPGAAADAWLYLGSHNQGLMLGRSSLIKSGHWALQTISGTERQAFRIDSDYLADRATFFVVCINFRPGPEAVSIWLDPQLGLLSQLPAESLQISVPDFSFNELGIYSTIPLTLDELRLGTSFESVTPIAPL